MYKDFTEMPVWEMAMKVAESVFHLTSKLPRNEDYGLTSQLRRAAVSISANIAEGFGRRSGLDKRKFYDYAKGSAYETKSLLLYGSQVGYFDKDGLKGIFQKIETIVHNLNKINKTLTHSKP